VPDEINFGTSLFLKGGFPGTLGTPLRSATAMTAMAPQFAYIMNRKLQPD